MNFKKKYYHHLIEGRSKNLENTLKEKMADREFKTFIFLLSNFFDENFSKKLGSLGDIYINDAFSCSHRKQSSIHNITKFMNGIMEMIQEAKVKL